jgi:hypothetical protein
LEVTAVMFVVGVDFFWTWVATRAYSSQAIQQRAFTAAPAVTRTRRNFDRGSTGSRPNGHCFR